MAKISKHQKIPVNVSKILAKLHKNEYELGEFCINNIVSNLRQSGYTDAAVWAASVLPAMLNELNYVEDIADMEDMLLNLDGMEKSIADSLYYNFAYLNDTLKGAKQKDIRDALVYSIAQTLETMDKSKYKKLYG